MFDTKTIENNRRTIEKGNERIGIISLQLATWAVVGNGAGLLQMLSIASSEDQHFPPFMDAGQVYGLLLFGLVLGVSSLVVSYSVAHGVIKPVSQAMDELEKANDRETRFAAHPRSQELPADLKPDQVQAANQKLADAIFGMKRALDFWFVHMATFGIFLIVMSAACFGLALFVPLVTGAFEI